MLDHVGFAVSDAERSRAFYEQALAPLGIALLMTATPDQTESGGTAHGFGSDGKPYFWVGDNEAVGEGTHVAFAADTRAKVDAFHQAALAAGGRDNGAPGLRPHYHANYYAAFVLDSDGINVEAVCHRPE
ncbi:MAG TPA: VOC family protein [Allosphingosinicella sp.]|nr:VOC family protein [Allosphingosinicella sp.]